MSKKIVITQTLALDVTDELIEALTGAIVLKGDRYSSKLDTYVREAKALSFQIIDGNDIAWPKPEEENI